MATKSYLIWDSNGGIRGKGRFREFVVSGDKSRGLALICVHPENDRLCAEFMPRVLELINKDSDFTKENA